ncbi:MAG: glycosyltransferase [Candidatus Aminicenantes bacterium]|nr:glycosyltransferase [Candidatus Aminicenantes bacterium]
MGKKQKKIIFIYNSARYLYNFRLSLMLSMKKRGWQVTAVSPYDKYARKIRNRGIRFKELAFRRNGKNPIEDLGLIFCLARFYQQEKPTIVHHFTIKPVIYGTLAARFSNVPGIVNLVPGLGYVFAQGGLLQHLVEKMYRCAFSKRVRVIFQNCDDMNFFIQKKLVRRKQAHLICGSGINTDIFSPDQFSDKKNSSVITFSLIARMLWDKGIAEFVEAAKIVHSKNKQTQFFLIGNPDSENPSSASAHWLKSLQNIDFIKWIEHKVDIRPFLASSSVIVLPSYREGAPRSLIEAASMAKPIITTDVPGCREIVVHGENGLLIPKKNAPLLAQAMLTLAHDPEKRKKMGVVSRKRALNDFDESLVIRKTQEIYAQVVDF